MPCHRARELGKFLEEVEHNVPDDLDIHVVMDNASTRKTRLIHDWLPKPPRRHIHFTLASSSWLNQVERFFALLTDKQLKRSADRSVNALIADIQTFIDR